MMYRLRKRLRAFSGIDEPEYWKQVFKAVALVAVFFPIVSIVTRYVAFAREFGQGIAMRVTLATPDPAWDLTFGGALLIIGPILLLYLLAAVGRFYLSELILTLRTKTWVRFNRPTRHAMNSSLVLLGVFAVLSPPWHASIRIPMAVVIAFYMYLSTAILLRTDRVTLRTPFGPPVLMIVVSAALAYSASAFVPGTAGAVFSFPDPSGAVANQAVAELGRWGETVYFANCETPGQVMAVDQRFIRVTSLHTSEPGSVPSLLALLLGAGVRPVGLVDAHCAAGLGVVSGQF